MMGEGQNTAYSRQNTEGKEEYHENAKKTKRNVWNDGIVEEWGEAK
jgi:hypothetical protein